MPRATCRCGQSLSVPADGGERVVCPKCGARVRIRRRPAATAPDDGYIRFFCPCGRRLKVDTADPPASGKCPDCDRVVPVPSESVTTSRPPGHPESPTEDLSAVDRDRLDRWTAKHAGPASAPAPASARVRVPLDSLPPTLADELGLRVCPACGSAVPLGSSACRACGGAVPKR